SNGTWYIYNLANNQISYFRFGLDGDIPVPADYDGDRKADIAVFRNGIWYMQKSTDGFAVVNFGLPGDKPIPSYYDDQDSKADIAVFRPSNRVWYTLKSIEGFSAMQFGLSTDKIIPTDYDGDWKTDFAVHRDGIWHIQRSNLGYASFQFGESDDIPTPNVFVR
ncbi:MAG: copper oxidase, partial [Pyrinomonadaceae bacterium]|nr:copper oxidase [Pyrinomonadaceae bacterium]